MKKFLFIFLSCLLFQQLTAQTIVKFDHGNNIIYKNLQGKTIVKNKKYTIAFTDTISSIGFVGTRKGEIVCINNAGKELFEVYKIDNGPDYVSDGLFRIVGKNSKIGFADTCGAIVIPPVFSYATPFHNGNDNNKQLEEKGIDSIANYILRHNEKAVFVVPQCPSDKSWGGPMLSVLKGLIDEQMQTTDMDHNRIYIFGRSMGGTGTWSMLSAYPGLFTSAMPVAGNPSQCIADNVVKTPIFTVMGTADRIMSVQVTSDFISLLNSLGGETMFETEDGWSHETTCVQSYTDQRIGWVMAHIKGEDDVESVRSEKAVCCTEYYALNGCRSDAPHNGIYVVKRLFTDGSLEAKLEYFDQ